eukprot:TRINITY_DN674_c0_g2_i1.p1 TRINITY_DN674_c0_g2~~TRINITY_DN674_c0_g2_i1.p1  ORF type:complete len:294 (-),score=85.44 TRINITY_DN674_c0_g2_i1:79-876(-)
MSKYRVRGEFQKSVKAVECERGKTTYDEVRIALEKKFGFALRMTYKFTNGNLRLINSEQAFKDALKDAEKTQTELRVTVQKDGPGGAAPATASPTTSTSSTGRPATAAAPQTSSPAKPPSSPSPAAKANTPTSPAPASGARPHVPNPQVSGGSATGCPVCGNPVTGSGVKAAGKSYHIECFNCHDCGIALQGAFQIHEGRLYCGDHYAEQVAPKCQGCGQAIRGMFISIDNKNYHDTCFVCSSCRSPLSGGYFQKGGSYLCRNCV